jgi:hypothetical protein
VSARTHDEVIDLVTGWLRGSLRFLMVQHPTRTSLGLTGGIFVATIIDALKPLIPGINVASLTDLRLAIAGVFVSNIGLLFKKERLPEALEQEFEAVRIAAREGKLGAAQRKMLYLKIAQTELDRVAFSKRKTGEEESLQDASRRNHRRTSESG